MQCGPSLSRYSAFFGREANLVLPPPAKTPNAPFVYRFPPFRAGFFKRFFAQAHDVGVYITDGMSQFPMDVPEREREVYPNRIELITYVSGKFVDDDGHDIVATEIQSLALMPQEQGIFFGPMHTCEYEQFLSAEKTMNGFFFAIPEGLDMNRLCSCTNGAGLVVSVMPITGNEIELAKAEGPEFLLEQFEANNVENKFNPLRPSVV